MMSIEVAFQVRRLFFVMVCFFSFVLGSELYGQEENESGTGIETGTEIKTKIETGTETETGIETEKKATLGSFFFALGENVFSNVGLHLMMRIHGEPWAQVDFVTIERNLKWQWEWDRDEFFTNQFGHPYQGSTYHAAARSSGFGFYESVLFDAFGSLAWELFAETNAPSINDFISTTLGGAALGEMFHRLYLETNNPLAVLISPFDALTDLFSPKHQAYTHNIYSLKMALGIGYTHAEQLSEQGQNEFQNSLTRNMASLEIAFAVIYGDPFAQQSIIPYEHFELSLDTNFSYPFWYSIKLLSDAYLFSFSVLDNEKESASTGLSLHYDLFADRQTDFFSQALDWTYKYTRKYLNGTNLEFKGHLGWTVFSADTFYIHNRYPGLREAANDYGTGTNLKLILAVQAKNHSRFQIRSFIYNVCNIYQNEDKDHTFNSFMFIDLDYSFPIEKQMYMGIASSSLRERAVHEGIPDTKKRTHDTKLYIAWKK
ncbi:MAG: DUF3943 domain-containing protein [Spirochaetaceae bacterium]|jgi:hypothetical protein|nr:DUF3943 domain-containing protein [Spirochaetaceae bacterium]